MIHRALLKAVGCCITGAVGAGILAYLLLDKPDLEIVDWDSYYRSKRAYEVSKLKSVILGALFGLIAGIGWAIKHREARWCFVGWTLAGWVAWAVLPWALDQIFGYGWDRLPDWWKQAFPLGLGVIGTAIGIVTALEGAGVFGKKDKRGST